MRGHDKSEQSPKYIDREIPGAHSSQGTHEKCIETICGKLDGTTEWSPPSRHVRSYQYWFYVEMWCLDDHMYSMSIQHYVRNVDSIVNKGVELMLDMWW